MGRPNNKTISRVVPFQKAQLDGGSYANRADFFVQLMSAKLFPFAGSNSAITRFVFPTTCKDARAYPFAASIVITLCYDPLE